MLKRYLAFGGDDYYPAGGACDFLGDFDTFEAAVGAVEGHPEGPFGWVHVLDAETRRVRCGGTILRYASDTGRMGRGPVEWESGWSDPRSV